MEQATCVEIRVDHTIYTLSVPAHQLRVRHPGDLITAEIVDARESNDRGIECPRPAPHGRTT